MQTILLVDDDAIVRISLRTILNWAQYGYTLVGEATDGEQALKMYHEYKPDILITDIKMPKIDGIELLKTLRDEPKPPVVIVLSSYDEYPLVREAMKLGAADYLLKASLSSQLLLDVLETSAPKKNVENSISPAIDLPALQRRVLWDFISNFYVDDASIAKKMVDVHIQQVSEQNAAFFLKLGDVFRFEEASAEDYRTLQFSLINIVEEISNEYMAAYCLEGRTGEFYVLGSVRPEFLGSQEEVSALLLETGERIQEMLLRYLDISCIVGIGMAAGGVEALRSAREQAEKASASRFCFEDATVLLYDPSIVPQEVEGPWINTVLDCRNQLLHSLLLFDEILLADMLDRIQQISQKLQRRDDLLFIAFYLCSTLQEHGSRYGNEDLWKRFFSSAQLFSINNRKAYFQWFNSLCSALQDFVHSEQNKGYQHVVASAQNIIRQRYAYEITVQEVSAELDISPGYLSTLMKKYLGMTFVEYVTNVRIQSACKLLKTTTDKIYEIAQQVGYQDQFYFSRIFKRIVGISPAEYRKRTDGAE